MGLYLMDVIALPSFGLDLRPTRSRGFGAAFTLGLLFGVALGPCTFAFMAPVIGVVFHTATTDIRLGLILFAAFAVGHCGVIAGAGSLATTVQRYLKWTGHSRATVWLRRVCGFLVVLGGIYLILTIP
jgi:cytochrome c-type biogenesis protein